jgi:hypothetical protein
VTPVTNLAGSLAPTGAEGGLDLREEFPGAGAQPYLGARSRGSGHMMWDRVCPDKEPRGVEVVRPLNLKQAVPKAGESVRGTGRRTISEGRIPCHRASLHPSRRCRPSLRVQLPQGVIAAAGQLACDREDGNLRIALMTCLHRLVVGMIRRGQAARVNGRLV